MTNNDIIISLSSQKQGIGMPTLEQLQQRLTLDAPLIEFITQLNANEQQQLSTLINQALDRQNQTIDSASEQALSMVPRVLRGAAKKLLLGGGK